MPLIDTLREAGFAPEEIGPYLAAERQKLRAAGFGDDEIAADLGVQDFQESTVRGYLATQDAARAGRALQPAPEGGQNPLAETIQGAAKKLGLSQDRAESLARVADDLAGGARAAEIGFQTSVTGLLARGKLPDQPARDLSRFESVMFQLGAITGDLPAMAAGAGLGAAVGIEGAAPITIPAGAMALPAGMREALMQSYEKGEVQSFGDYLDRALSVAWETAKGAITGAAVGRAGQVAPPLLKLPAEIATLVSVGSGLEGRIPEPGEFVDAAVVIGGLHAAGLIAGKLRNIYAKTGREPAQVLQDSQADPSIRADLTDAAKPIPDAYKGVAEAETAGRARTLDEAADGLRQAMDDPAKLEELQAKRPDIRDAGDAQAMYERVTAERDRLSGKPFDEARATETALRIGEVPDLTEPRFTNAINAKVAGAAEELLASGAVARDPNRLLSDQVMELLQTNRLTGADFRDTLARHGLTPDEFADVWRVNVRRAARDLAALSQVEARVRRLAETATEADNAVLRQAGMDYEAQAQGLWRRLDNLRRGLLVTQLATAVRNFETQVGRVGVDVLQKGLDAGLQRLFPGAARTVKATDGFETVLRLFQRDKTRKMADEILARFPKEGDDLFQRYSSDLNRAGAGTGVMAKAERGVELLNWANRFQEFAVRRAVFVSTLEQRLRAKGQKMEKIIARNETGKIEREDVKVAVENALEMTWAKSFSAQAAGAEGVAGAFIQFVNKMPGATILVPFPRFLMNAMKYQFEFSPFGMLKLLSKSERAKIAAGDTTTLSRALIGTGFLFAAYQFRNSDWAGEKWWELRLKDGSTVDLRPFNPFASYLFVADVAKRLKEGTIRNLAVTDVINGVLSSSLRAGAGLYLVDTIVNGIAGIGDEEKALNVLAGGAGQVLSGFLVPLQQVRDVYAQFDQWFGAGKEALIRDMRDRPFTGPIISKIPGLSQTLPEAEIATREAPLRRVMPLVRQATGLGFNDPKNAAERELDRLGFTRGEVMPTTGQPAADRLIAKYMGPLVEQAVVPMVETPFYQRLSNEVKGGLLREAMLGVRKVAIAQARAEDPAIFLKIKIQGMPERQRLMIESLTGKSLKDLTAPPP